MIPDSKPSPCELLEARFVDLVGRAKAIAIPLKQPSADPARIATDPAVLAGISVDGSSITGYAHVENSDLHLSPDPQTVFLLPYHPGRAAAFCDVRQRGVAGEHTPFPLDPRGRLKAVLAERLAPHQQIHIKPELEFYFLRGDRPADAAGYVDVYPREELCHHMDRVYRVLNQMGVPVERVHHENGPGQVEVELDYAPILAQADHLSAAKTAIQAIAYQEGLRATFMPKPFANIAGSGMHVHFRLFDEAACLFGAGPGELTDTARYFIAGLLAHARALTAICNPTVNSYKRLVPGHEAPVHICWGHRNRSVLVRVPLSTDPAKAAVEFRSPDATCNFHLALAAIVAAGMDGVRRRLAPPDPRTENIDALSSGQLRRLGIKPLPSDLGEALDALERDEVVLAALGEHIAPRFLDLHRAAWDEYLHGAVTDWEWTTYADV
jgi:glutamine synthetase